MEINKNINKKIFREYDIRGVYPTDIDESVSYTIGLAFGSIIRKKGFDTCLIGHDNRLSSDSLYENLINGLKQVGVNIVSLGLCTTPMYYYASIKLGIKSGIMITASHNPKDDNGFKISFETLNTSGNSKGKEIQDFYDYIQNGEILSGEGSVKEYNIKDEYFELYKKSLNFGDRRIKAVIDSGNGTTSIIAEELYKLFPIDIVPIFTESDGHFPNHHPDPAVEDNLKVLKETVIREKADIGVGFDGDGDRVGVITNTGRFLPMDHYLILMIRDIFDKVDKKAFLYDVKCSRAVEDVIDSLGGECVCSRTGNSYTRAGVYEKELPIGAELSGHVYFNDRFPGFDSGLYAGLRIIELLSRCDKSIEELTSDIPKYFATDEIKVKTRDEIKFDIINKVKEYVIEKGYKYLDIDGVKVLFDDGFALVRASNTGPNLTMRFEAKTEERLSQINGEFVKLVDEFNK